MEIQTLNSAFKAREWVDLAQWLTATCRECIWVVSPSITCRYCIKTQNHANDATQAKVSAKFEWGHDSNRDTKCRSQVQGVGENRRLSTKNRLVPIGDWGHLLTLTMTSDDLESHIVVNVSSSSNIIQTFIKIGRKKFFVDFLAKFEVTWLDT